MKRFCIALTLVTLLAVQACSDRKGRNFNKIDDNGLTFVNAAAEAGAAEVKISQLALKNSQNSEVIKFAKMMIADHTDAGNELKKIASDSKISANDSLSATHNHLLASLSAKNGVAFDKEYIQAMVIDHEKAIEVFKEGSINENTKLKDFAAKTLPKLEGHLKEANALCTDLK
jgi:putative membrane protein